MHYSTHALLNCVALLSLLCNVDAGKTPPPSEVLSHFALAVGSVLNPTLSAEPQRPNRSASHDKSRVKTRRQVDARQISPKDVAGNSASAERAVAGPANGVGSLPFPGQGYPYQYERSYSYRYPPFSQQLSQNFFPGGGNSFSNQLLPNGLPFDPRLFQSQLNRNPQLPANQLEAASKGVNAKLTAASDGNVKESGNNNVNTLQNLNSNVDSKSSAQNRPFDNADFSAVPINPGQGGGNLGLDPNGGNLRVDNRYSAIDYERIRQNYYSDPPISQRYYSFNEIPFSGGPPYRSPLSERFSNLEYNGANEGGRNDGASSGLRPDSGLGNPYFGNFFHGPYHSLNYNNLQGSGNGRGIGVSSANNDGGAPFAPGNFDRGGSQNLRSPFGLQYPGGFGSPDAGLNFEGPSGGGANFRGPGGDAGFAGPGGDAGNTGIGRPGGDSGFFPAPGDFGDEGDSSLRASSSKQSIARPVATAAATAAAAENSEENRASVEQLDDRDERERIDRQQKVRFVDGDEKHANAEDKRSSKQ